MTLEHRARQSGGTSSDAIHTMVVRALATRGIGGGMALDVGCGSGSLRARVASRIGRYVGVDAVRYPGFPADAEFHRADLDGALGLPDAFADLVLAVEVVEHLENPRAFVRELTRVVRPGGWVIITTPNQLSLLSLATLVRKQRFAAFQDVDYPAHLTALLPIDLVRIARECGLGDVAVEFSGQGRIAWTGRPYPAWLGRRFPRACSDNVLLAARRPA